MIRYKRIPAKRAVPRVIHPERSNPVDGHIRERLTGKAREKRRAEIFERAGRYCEEIIRCQLPECNEGGKAWHTFRCPNPPTEWSHKKHGARKCDCLDCGIASCRECHNRKHRPKACPKKTRAVG